MTSRWQRIRDFTGVFLVAATAGVPTLAAQSWILSAQPIVRIGTEGDARTEFSRIVGVVRLPSGDIAIADATSSNVRIFTAAGAYLRGFGRRGQGPGEFVAMGRLIAAGDTLFIPDFANKRITPFLSDGTLLDSRRITDTRVSVIGRVPSGRWVVTTGYQPTLQGPQRVYQDSSRVGWLAASAAGGVQWLPEGEVASLFVYNPANGPHGVMVGMTPFGPRSVTAVVGDRILLGESSQSSVRIFTDGGMVASTMNLPVTDQPLTDAAVTVARDAQLASARNDVSRGYAAALFSRANLPRNSPSYGALIPGADGEIWIVPYPGMDATAPFIVIDHLGHVLAHVAVPAGFKLWQVGRDFLLGVHTDDVGLEQVQLFHLDRRSH
jgi:hypothetical protein